MRAREKRTGRMWDVEVQGRDANDTPIRYCTFDLKHLFRPDELEFDFVEEDNVKAAPASGKGFDWTAFRAEAAKTILCGLISVGYGADSSISEVVKRAVKTADLLIVELNS